MLLHSAIGSLLTETNTGTRYRWGGIEESSLLSSLSIRRDTLYSKIAVHYGTFRICIRWCTLDWTQQRWSLPVVVCGTCVQGSKWPSSTSARIILRQWHSAI